MSLNVALNVAVSGLFANQRAIAATSENIANANTADFTRREVSFATDAIPNQFSGVSVDVARAATNRFLQNSVFSSNSDAAGATLTAEALSRIETSLGAPGDNISFANRLGEAFASLASLSSTPNSDAAKADALFALEEAFSAFGRTLDVIDTEAINSVSQLTQTLARANVLLEEIFDLNQIAAESDGAQDLINARATELSSLIPINVVAGDDGRVAVSTTGGTVLANTGGYAALGITTGQPVSITLSSVSSDGSTQTLVDGDFGASISGGEIGGLLGLVNTELPALSSLVEAAARGVVDELNAVYAGNASVGQTGSDGSPLIIESAGRFSVNSVLIDDPSRFAIARPDAGFVGGASDGSGAAALSNVSASIAAGAANESIASIGAAVRNATQRAETRTALAAEISSRSSSEGGVNLDEELSNLILYQRSYNANARVIAAVDELWESLLAVI